MPTYPKRRSDSDILQFIAELPGGSVPQYAKLLGTTAIRINGLLHDGDGRKLVKRGAVVAAEKGMMPTWATRNTTRGCLRASDVDGMRRENTLPPFIAKLLAQTHSRFQDDALNFLREALDQTAGKRSFEAQMTSYFEQHKHDTDHIVENEGKILRLESEIDRFDRVMERAGTMADLLEDMTKRSGAATDANVAQDDSVAA